MACASDGTTDLSSPKRQRTLLSEPRRTSYRSCSTGVTFVYDPASLPSDAVLLHFAPLSGAQIPENSISHLTGIVRHHVSHIYDTIYGPTGLIFIIRKDASKEKAFLDFATNSTVPIPPTGFRFRPSLTNFPQILVACEELVEQDEQEMALDSSSDSETHNTSPAPVSTPQTANTPVPAPPWLENEPARPPVTALASESAPIDSLDNPTENPAPKFNLTAKFPRNKKRVFRNIDFSQVIVNIPEKPAHKTVLFKPLDKNDKLSNIHPGVLCKELLALGSHHGMRDIRDGGLAVDFDQSVSLDPVLSVNSLSGISVSVSLPVGSAACCGVIRGVHFDVTNQEILEEAHCFPDIPITGSNRLAKKGLKSWTVKVMFAGSTIPERIFLFGRSYEVAPFKHKVLQCQKCFRYAHHSNNCRSNIRCSFCGLPHVSEECSTPTQPRCPNCGGPHPATDSTCPAYAFQKKVCDVKLKNKTTFRIAKIETTKAVRSYANALKSKTSSTLAVSTAKTYAQASTSAGNLPTNNETIAKLFKVLIEILQKAVATQNFSTIIQDVTGAFGPALQ